MGHMNNSFIRSVVHFILRYSAVEARMILCTAHIHQTKRSGSYIKMKKRKLRHQVT